MESKIITYGIPDKEFVRGNVPMTKEEVRTITLSKLRLCLSDHVLDIGAGTGSISIEAALLVKEGMVYAVEHHPEAIGLIDQNVRKFGVKNLKVIAGTAPGALAGIENITKVNVGGTGGHLVDILEWADGYVQSGGRIVVNAITLETLNGAQTFFKQHGYSDLEIVQVAISRFEAVGGHSMLKANTPVFIISALMC
jgi:precorrin-6Y C5,15-methyltransferase (decarboxylating) CbiT subunit